MSCSAYESICTLQLGRLTNLQSVVMARFGIYKMYMKRQDDLVVRSRAMTLISVSLMTGTVSHSESCGGMICALLSWQAGFDPLFKWYSLPLV